MAKFNASTAIEPSKKLITKVTVLSASAGWHVVTSASSSPNFAIFILGPVASLIGVKQFV